MSDTPSYYIHRRNIEEKSGYDLEDIIDEEINNGKENFGTYIIEEDGRERNYKAHFEKAKKGDFVILEYKIPKESKDIIWGYTEIEEIKPGKRKRLIFSRENLRKTIPIDVKKLDFNLPRVYTFKKLQDKELEELKERMKIIIEK